MSVGAASLRNFSVIYRAVSKLCTARVDDLLDRFPKPAVAEYKQEPEELVLGIDPKTLESHRERYVFKHPLPEMRDLLVFRVATWDSGERIQMDPLADHLRLHIPLWGPTE